MNSCPLCRSQQLSPFHQDEQRAYLICGQCKLVSVPDEYLLSAADEKAFYDHHQNNSEDMGYRRFLGRTWLPLSERLTPEMQGLDFGCGPGPTISVMAAEQGLKMDNYDLYYFHRPALLQRQYDFITMTEVIEHVGDAQSLLQQLHGMLKPQGVLAIMTKRVLDEAAFARWHYKSDQTHIRFYSIDTFQWIADHFQWQLEVIDKDVVFFTRT
ncbi:class I SAM-dependent methyltransferase [Shewanella sp. Isolate11]|uniref:class I SAM-dependent methyltransferase n=1 Tax=Shewanella sp. Isolate11 TaxID=2908530 RepID=UPI001EFC4444|nr:class I SAM-dependent methyltransferase [Shewanella sp. Isolate11]MCG9697880.1 class I SAM-dependent methyltransferase [Shewanella sp. Isolate11]